MEEIRAQYFVNTKRAIHGFPHRIRQFKKAGVWKDDPEFRAAIERNIDVREAFMLTENYRKNVLPKSQGGEYHNYYFYGPFMESAGILRDCLNALDAKIEPISSEEAEKLKPENIFPIVFASVLPGQEIYNLAGELQYNALISLRHDIDAIYVPDNKVDYMNQWLVDNGIVVDGKGPKVLDIDNIRTKRYSDE